MRLFRPLLGIILVLLGGCSSSDYLSSHGHAYLERGDYLKAAEIFSEKSEEVGKDQLLFLLESGMAYFRAQDYEKAVEFWLRAEDLAEIKDYTSISEEVGVLGTGEAVRGYKGEDYEKVLINDYLALAFAAQGKLESALVECRKINLLLNKMIDDGDRNYQESAFARYLSGMLWELSEEYSSAYIDYEKAFELDPELPNLVSNLIYAAERSGRKQMASRWRSEWPNVKLRRKGAKKAEFIAFLEKGRSPVKVPRRSDPSLPEFHRLYSEELSYRLVVGGEVFTDFEEVLDIANTSKEYLEDRIQRLKLARLAGTATKALLSASAAAMSDSEDLGWISFWILMQLDKADLRSWQGLPAEIHMYRGRVNEGSYPVTLEVLDSAGELKRTVDYGVIEFKNGEAEIFVGR